MRTTPLGTFLLRNKNDTIFFDSALCKYKKENITRLYFGHQLMNQLQNFYLYKKQF